MDDDTSLHDALRRSEGVVLQAYPNLAVLNAVQHFVGEVAARGRNVVLLADATHQSAREALEPNWGVFLQEAYRADRFDQGAAHLCTVDEFTRLLRDPEHANWVDRLGLILIPQGEQVLTRPYAWELMAFAVRDRFAPLRLHSLPRCLVIIDRRRSPEPAIRDALPLYGNYQNAERNAWREYTAPMPPGRPLWWTVWSKQDHRAYLSGLHAPNDQGQSVGVSAPLAQFAGRWGIDVAQNLVPFSPESGDKDHFQAIQNALGRELFTGEPERSWACLPTAAGLIGGVTLAETQGNPWRLLRRVANAYTGTVISNLVVSNTMLLPYLVANADMFAQAPLKPLSPLVSREVPFDTAIQVVQRIHLAGRLPIDVIRDALAATAHPCKPNDPGLLDTFTALKRLVHTELSEGLANRLSLVIDPHWQQDDEPQFDMKAHVELTPAELVDVGVEWLDEFTVEAEGGNIFHHLRRDHVSQTFWTGKIVSMDGSKYIVDAVDNATGIIRVTPHDVDVIPDYRPERVVQVLRPEAEWVAVHEARPVTLASGEVLRCDAFRLAFQVECTQVVVSEDHWASAPASVRIDKATRHYKTGRAVRLTMLDTDGQSILTPGAAVALAAWLNEAAVTLLPEVAPFVLAVPEVDDEDRPENRTAAMILPKLAPLPGRPKSRRAATGKAIPAVWVFEDSNSDLGIARAMADAKWYLLDVCHDWLSWWLMVADKPNGAEPVCLDNAVRPPADWFAWGCDQRDAALDFQELHLALKRFASKYQEVSTRRRNRRKFSLLEGTGRLDVAECDFCGVRLERNEPRDTLDDGRVSCKPCTEVGVHRVAQLQALMTDLALPFFKAAHQIDDFGPVSVELVDQREMSEASGKRFIPTSGHDRRSIGLAIGTKRRVQSASEADDRSHRVLIESGFSPERSASTLVHELCHVWQFEHLDFAGMQRDHGQHLIEGHAVWAEDSFLKWVRSSRPDLVDAKRLEDAEASHELLKAAANEYGEGYHLILSKLGPLRASAFEWLINEYPRR